MKLVILAGGKGTRLGLRDLPKPMAAIAGKPILAHQIELAKRYGLTEIVMLSGYLANVIEQYFGDGARFGVRITHLKESRPLGTAGAVKQLEAIMDAPFMIFYGDTIMDIDLQHFIACHDDRSIASILVHPNDHPHDSDLLEVRDDETVARFHPKPHPAGVFYGNLVNAALYIVAPAIFRYIPADQPSDFGKDIFPRVLAAQQRVRAYKTSEYIKDIGTPERLREVEQDIISGKVGRLNRARRRKAIFLDRDGVINREVKELFRLEQFELLDGAAQAIGMINRSEYLALVVTNQPVVAKGFCTEADLRQIHNKMETLLGEQGAYLDAIYYCPHHPEKGFPGEDPRFKIECACRKPKIGMIARAIADYNIDPEHSFMIGDRTVDVMTGQNAGIKTILLNTGYAGQDGLYHCTPDLTAENLYEAVQLILETDWASSRAGGIS